MLRTASTRRINAALAYLKSIHPCIRPLSVAFPSKDRYEEMKSQSWDDISKAIIDSNSRRVHEIISDLHAKEILDKNVLRKTFEAAMDKKDFDLAASLVNRFGFLVKFFDLKEIMQLYNVEINKNNLTTASFLARVGIKNFEALPRQGLGNLFHALATDNNLLLVLRTTDDLMKRGLYSSLNSSNFSRISRDIGLYDCRSYKSNSDIDSMVRSLQYTFSRNAHLCEGNIYDFSKFLYSASIWIHGENDLLEYCEATINTICSKFDNIGQGSKKGNIVNHDSSFRRSQLLSFLRGVVDGTIQAIDMNSRSKNTKFDLNFDVHSNAHSHMYNSAISSPNRMYRKLFELCDNVLHTHFRSPFDSETTKQALQLYLTVAYKNRVSSAEPLTSTSQGIEQIDTVDERIYETMLIEASKFTNAGKIRSVERLEKLSPYFALKMETDNSIYKFEIGDEQNQKNVLDHQPTSKQEEADYYFARFSGNNMANKEYYYHHLHSKKHNDDNDNSAKFKLDSCIAQGYSMLASFACDDVEVINFHPSSSYERVIARALADSMGMMHVTVPFANDGTSLAHSKSGSYFCPSQLYFTESQASPGFVKIGKAPPIIQGVFERPSQLRELLQRDAGRGEFRRLHGDIPRFDTLIRPWLNSLSDDELCSFALQIGNKDSYMQSVQWGLRIADHLVERGLALPPHFLDNMLLFAVQKQDSIAISELMLLAINEKRRFNLRGDRSAQTDLLDAKDGFDCDSEEFYRLFHKSIAQQKQSSSTNNAKIMINKGVVEVDKISPEAWSKGVISVFHDMQSRFYEKNAQSLFMEAIQLSSIYDSQHRFSSIRSVASYLSRIKPRDTSTIRTLDLIYRIKNLDVGHDEMIAVYRIVANILDPKLVSSAVAIHLESSKAAIDLIVEQLLERIKGNQGADADFVSSILSQRRNLSTISGRLKFYQIIAKYVKSTEFKELSQSEEFKQSIDDIVLLFMYSSFQCCFDDNNLYRSSFDSMFELCKSLLESRPVMQSIEKEKKMYRLPIPGSDLDKLEILHVKRKSMERRIRGYRDYIMRTVDSPLLTKALAFQAQELKLINQTISDRIRAVKNMERGRSRWSKVAMKRQQISTTEQDHTIQKQRESSEPNEHMIAKLQNTNLDSLRDNFTIGKDIGPVSQVVKLFKRKKHIYSEVGSVLDDPHIIDNIIKFRGSLYTSPDKDLPLLNKNLLNRFARKRSGINQNLQEEASLDKRLGDDDLGRSLHDELSTFLESRKNRNTSSVSNES